jgi:hypothetical protein
MLTLCIMSDFEGEPALMKMRAGAESANLILLF